MATVHEATGHACVAAISRTSLMAVAQLFRGRFPQAQIVLCADDNWKTDGNPGLADARAAAKAVGGVVAVPEFGGGRGEKDTDFNDMARTSGNDAVRGHFLECLRQNGKADEEPFFDGPVCDGAPPKHFELIPFDAVRIDTTPAYLVKGIVPRVGLCVFWGPPKCGKSFLVFDLMMHVALGWEYRDRKVRQGSVAYCALEGCSAFKNRIEAFRQTRLQENANGVPFHLMPSPMTLVADQPALIASIRNQAPAPAAVVIDTLNRSLAGSESSDEDMSAYVRAADAVRDAFNCAVIIVHHCGHEGTRPRGHSSLMGALDAQVAVTVHAARTSYNGASCSSCFSSR